MHTSLSSLLDSIAMQYSHQPVFNQVVREIIESLDLYLAEQDASPEEYERVARLLEPERIITFKIVWSNDQGKLQHNSGWRVQFNSALGPYKGGLRFDPSVNEDVLKFLGFEQIFKNALTGLSLGGGKGGSDFNPKGKSDNEVRNFCRAYMLELARYIGPDTDVPAGDIGVGAREIGYMYGMHKQLSNKTQGVLSGKPVTIGGSRTRTEATGYGVVYFLKAMLEHDNQNLIGKKTVVSGSGNVAEFTVRKLISEEAIVLTMSDRNSYIYKTTGFSNQDIDVIMNHKKSGKDLASLEMDDTDVIDGSPWQSVEAAIYIPCATQNEVCEKDAAYMLDHAIALVEGANMPLEAAAQRAVRSSTVLYGPSKAANAGGVAVSSLEMSQNAMHTQWTAQEVDKKLQTIMKDIHARCVEYGTGAEGKVDYVNGSNIAGGVRVLEAMKLLGW
jgi:glutamate dehydrogenase (NADP+)